MSPLSENEGTRTPIRDATEPIVQEGPKHGDTRTEAEARHISLASGVAPHANRSLDDVVEPAAGGAQPNDAHVFRLPAHLIALGVVLPDVAGDIENPVREDKTRPAAFHGDDGITTWIEPNSRAGLVR